MSEPGEVVAVVQARMGNTRLPGKVLEPLGDTTVLGLLLRRLRRATTVDRIVVATTGLAEDDPIATLAGDEGVDVARGDVEDVLGRFVAVADAHSPSVLVRITADCPLTDPDLVDQAVDTLRAEGLDVVSNDGPTYLRGFDVEAFTVDALRQADAGADRAHERVHVTPWMYAHPDQVRVRVLPWPGEHGHLRLTIDTAEDLEVVREVVARTPDAVRAPWRALAAVLEADPFLAAVNRGVQQKRVEDG